MKGGTFGTLPDWALNALPDLSPTAMLVLVRLAYAAKLHVPTLTFGQLMDYTGRSADQLKRALAELEGAGHIRKDGSNYALKTAGISASKSASKNAAGKPEKDRAGQRIKTSEEVEEVEEVLSSFTGLEDEADVGLPEDPEQHTAQGADAPAADAAPESIHPSQGVQIGLGHGETEQAQRSFGVRPPRPAAAPIRAAHYGDDDAAVQFFHTLTNYKFASDHRPHLARWFESYTPEFLRLAWQLAPTLPQIRVGTYSFVFLLNREREWPEALKAQYERDVAHLSQPQEAAPAARVKAGDLLRWPDGVIARVERVDHADAVTDAEDAARGYVPLALIGKTVEVLRA